MPRTRNPYPADFRDQIIALARAGRSVESLVREFEPCAATIVGASNVAQLTGNIAAAHVYLNADQTERLNAVSKPADSFTSSLGAAMIRRMIYGGHDVMGWGE